MSEEKKKILQRVALVVAIIAILIGVIAVCINNGWITTGDVNGGNDVSESVIVEEVDNGDDTKDGNSETSKHSSKDNQSESTNSNGNSSGGNNPGNQDANAGINQGNSQANNPATNTNQPGLDTSTKNDNLTCTIEIRCDELLSNMDKLSSSKQSCVPSNGIILSKTKVSVKDGTTVFDILKSVCANKGISLDTKYTALYGQYYLVGINNICEKDCGNMSGWVYLVNNWSPTYSCSDYYIEDGDNIVFTYTCDGIA